MIKKIINNSVPLIFMTVIIFAVPLSNFSAEYIIQELLTRTARNAFLILSLLIPITAGLDLRSYGRSNRSNIFVRFRL